MPAARAPTSVTWNIQFFRPTAWGRNSRSRWFVSRGTAGLSKQSSLRPVQEEAGHAILDGCNAVILAPTAGGKTEASLFPVLAGLMDREPEGVGALYVAPITGTPAAPEPRHTVQAAPRTTPARTPDAGR